MNTIISTASAVQAILEEDRLFTEMTTLFNTTGITVEFLINTALNEAHNTTIRNAAITALIDTLECDPGAFDMKHLRRLERGLDTSCDTQYYTRYLNEQLLSAVESELNERHICPGCGCDERVGRHGVTPFAGSRWDSYCDPYELDYDSVWENRMDDIPY